jgi:uncharacterized protein
LGQYIPTDQSQWDIAMKERLIAAGILFSYLPLQPRLTTQNFVALFSIKKNYGLALATCTAAFEQGIADAQYILDLMYRGGDGVEQDNAAAVRWYRAAAEQGYAAAQNNLGWMYQHGFRLIQNYSDAVRWYRIAAESGDAWAQKALALLYALGEGVMENYVIAHMWSNISATNGDEDAVELRNLIASSMTPDKIAEAQVSAQQCLDSNYTYR